MTLFVKHKHSEDATRTHPVHLQITS